MVFWNKSASPHPEPLYGVNLGGWLVLEKWMTPSLFEGFSAADEYTLCEQMGSDMAPRLQRHRDSFITLMDFEWLKAQGVSTVRLPVGYWAFGDAEPYAGTIEYIDKAFEWARQTDIKILLDMHGAPGSQNGKDHSGKSGDTAWDETESYIIQTLEVLTRLVQRYKDHSSLLGVELLNEPSSSIPKHKLMKYYKAAYKMIRWECGEDVWVVFSDGFRPRRWQRKLRGHWYSGVYIDTHQYQVFGKKDKKRSAAQHVLHTLTKVDKMIRRMQRYHSAIVGEWSLALDAGVFKGMSDSQVRTAYRAYGAAQLMVYGQVRAWFYWSYKTEDKGPWSFRDSLDNGLLEIPKNRHI